LTHDLFLLLLVCSSRGVFASPGAVLSTGFGIKPENRGSLSKDAGLKSEDGRAKSKDAELKSEDGGAKSKDNGAKSEDAELMSKDGGLMSEDGEAKSKDFGPGGVLSEKNCLKKGEFRALLSRQGSRLVVQ
jgi:hypothetical protein